MHKQDYIVVNNNYTYNKLSKQLLSGNKIITTNITLSRQLKVMGEEHINLWRYLTDDIIQKSEILTIENINKLNSFDTSEINYEGVSVFEITKIFLRYFYKAYFHTIFALEKFLFEETVGKIYINAIKGVPLNVSNFDSSNLLDSLSEFYFRNNRIDINYYKTNNSNYFTNFYPKSLEKNYSEFDFNEANREKKTKTLFLLSENFEWDFDVIRHFKKSVNMNSIVVWRIPFLEKSTNKNKHPLVFHHFEYLDDDIIDYYDKIDNIKNIFLNEFILTLFGKYKYYDCLNFQFVDFFDKIKKIILDLKTFDRIVNFVHPQKIYFSNSWDMSVRCMIKRAMDLGCETYVSIHGGVVDNSGYTTRTLNVDNYLVWGKDNYEGLLIAGQKPDTIKMVGSMQMDFWKNKLDEYKITRSTYNDTEYSGYFNFDSSNIIANDKFTVIFFTSAGGGFTSHSIQEYYHLNSLEKIKILATKHPDILFKIKPHILFDYPDYWLEFKTNLPDNLEVINEKDLLKACLELDLGVLLNTMSNVAFEISLSGKPLIFLKDACFNVKCAESGIERGGILCLNSVVEFEDYLLKYINSYDLKLDLETRRKQFLNLNLCDDGKSTKERIRELLEKPFIGNNKFQNNSNKSLFSIIEWVRKSVCEDLNFEFPEINPDNSLPNGNYLKSWLYCLTEEWCRYYEKNEKLNIYYSKLLFAVPPQFKISLASKIKSSFYSKTRDFYLKHNLNNTRISKYFRNKRKLIRNK